MFRKPAKRKEQTIRTREREEVDGDASADIVKDLAKRKRRDNPMIQSTKKKDEKQDNASSSSSDEEIVNEHAYPASGTDAPLGPLDRGATFTTEKDTSYEADAQSQFERVQQILKEGGVEKDGKVLYKGMALYGAKIAPDTIKGNAANGLNRIGPMRAPQFMRQTVRWDYAPDICKDYKETGFCTFGDSCKFLHDRSDYKHGWEIERDYLAGNLNEVDDTNFEIPQEDEDAFPEECFICGNAFENPIVTSCKHYFCESCAIKAFKKSKRCRICNENTGGIFNVAKDLMQKMREKQVKQEEPQEESDDEEKKPDIASEENEHHHGGCSHSHEVKEEPVDETGTAPDEVPNSQDDEQGEDQDQELDQEDEEQQEDVGPQQEVEISMEDVEDDENISNSSDVDDEDEEDK